MVQQIPTEIKTRQSWIPNDTALIRSSIGSLPTGGTVTVTLCGNPTCAGGSLFSQTVAVPGGAPTAEVSTTNTTTVSVQTGYVDPANSTVTYSWKVDDTPGGASHTGKQNACDAERFTITYRNDPGPGTDKP